MTSSEEVGWRHGACWGWQQFGTDGSNELLDSEVLWVASKDGACVNTVIRSRELFSSNSWRMVFDSSHGINASLTASSLYTFSVTFSSEETHPGTLQSSAVE